ncbi:MAG: hypothetical protein ABW046_15050 [Actinoplanes sp.]
MDDAVRAGQRRLKRRQAGWAIAAVAVVAVTIGVPQILTPRAAAPLPAAPSPSSFVSPGLAYTFSFRGYTVGQFRVADPESWSLAGETSMIMRKSPLAILEGSPLGTLTVLRPGVDTVTAGRDKLVETEPIRGRRAFFIEPKSADPTAIVQLAWEYADDGSLAIVSHLQPELTRADLRKIAEGFTLGDEHPVTVGFRIGHLPSGWKLIRTSTLTSQFASTRQAVARLARPDRSSLPPEMADSPELVTVGLIKADQVDRRPSAKPWCDKQGQGFCSYHPTGDGPVITISFGTALSEAEAKRVLMSVQVGAVPAEDGIPASARMTAG